MFISFNSFMNDKFEPNQNLMTSGIEGCQAIKYSGLDSEKKIKLSEMNFDSMRKRRRPGSPANMNDDHITTPFESTPHQSRQKHFPFSTPDPSPFPFEKAFGDGRSPFPLKSAFPSLLLSPSLHGPDNLSEMDVLVCKNVEVFQATQEDVTVSEMSSSSQMRVVINQIGIRCVHCDRAPFPAPENSVIYPASISLMSSSLRLLSEHHFPHCRSIPSRTKSDMRLAEETAESRRRVATQGNMVGEEDEWNRIALVDFCIDFCKTMNIINRQPGKSGIIFDSSEGQKMRSSPKGFRGPGGMMQPTPVASKNRRNQEKTQTTKAEKTAISPVQIQASPQSQVDLNSAQKSQGSERETVRPESFPQYMENNQNHMYGTQGRQGSHAPHHSQSYEHPGSANYPFFQDGYGNWACRYCVSIPYNYRAPNSMWQSPQPPHPQFIEQHMAQCRGSQTGQSSLGQMNPMYSAQHSQQSYPPSAPTFGHSHLGWTGSQHGHHHPNYQQGMVSSQTTLPHLSGSYGHYADQPGHQIPHNPHYHYQQPPFYPAYGHSGPSSSDPHNRGSSRSMHMPMGTNAASSSTEISEAIVASSIEYLQKADKEHRIAMADTPEGITDLVLDEDKLLLTDYFFYIMKQLKICRFSESDRKTRGGKRENVAVGYGGLQCIHCAESPNSRKFFWSNVDRLANSFAEIPGHVLKCRRCPNQTKVSLQELKKKHPDQMSNLPRGSQKVFFRRMWRRLHDEDPDNQSTGSVDKNKSGSRNKDLKVETISTDTGDSRSKELRTPLQRQSQTDETNPNQSPGKFSAGMSTEKAAKALVETSSTSPSSSKRILLSLEEDKEWLSDMDCFIRTNIEVFCATNDDVETALSDRKYPIHRGQVGIRCLHCAQSEEGEGARGTAVSFPYSISGIYESVREFQRLHLESCPCIPSDVRGKLEKMKGSTSLSSVLRRYYIIAAKALGMHDTTDGIRASGESLPIGSSATYDFASTSTPSVSKEGSRQPPTPGSSSSFLQSGPAVTPLESRKRKSFVEIKEERHHAV